MADVNQGAGADGAGAGGTCPASYAQTNGTSDVGFPIAHADPGADLVVPAAPDQSGIAALLQHMLASTQAVAASTQGMVACVAVPEQA